jgi:hypothetical protein
MKVEATGLEEPASEAQVDLGARVKLCDIEGVAALLGTTRRGALGIITKAMEEEAGGSERRILRTGDARKVKRDLLEIFANRASSALAKNRFLLLVPSCDRSVIKSRLGFCLKASETFQAVKGLGRLDSLRKTLAELSFTSRKSTGSAVLDLFAARKEVLDAAERVLTDFSDVGPVMSIFKDISAKSLREVLVAVEETGGMKMADPEAAISDAEVAINEALRKGARSRERALAIIEDQVGEVVSALGLNLDEEQALKKAALESPSVPFEFDRTGTRRLIEAWRDRKKDELAKKLQRVEAKLMQSIPLANQAVEGVVLLDQMLATGSTMEECSLSIPELGTGGIGFLNALNPFLLGEEPGGAQRSLQPVSYSVGKPSIRLAKPRNAVILTGANSGGKTTLLNTLAAIHVLTLLGLPVPAERAEVTPMPIYLFRKRVARKAGSLEHVLRSIIPVLADRRRKLVLIDELEALTEPGAAGRIIAAIINRAATTSSLFLLVTHLAKETLPHVRFPVRVDGIEASGLKLNGELAVDRQPRFDHIGSSTPKLIVLKLSKTAKDRAVKAIYDDVLASLEGETGPPVQAPIMLPWAGEETA